MSDHDQATTSEKRKDISEEQGMSSTKGEVDASWRERCIYKVPETLRKIKPEAYTPQLISIGPLRRKDDDQPRSLEKLKEKYVDEFLLCVNEGDRGPFLKIIEKNKEKIHKCYEDLDLNAEEKGLVNLILNDSIFIIELFIRNYWEDEWASDYIVGIPWRMLAVKQDLILLENQMPYFILEDLYNYAFANNAKYPSFSKLTCFFFGRYIKAPAEGHIEDTCDCWSGLYCFWLTQSSCSIDSHNQQEKENAQPFTPKHFTDLIRWHLSQKHPSLPKNPDSNGMSHPQHCIDLSQCCISRKANKKNARYLVSATKLHEAGVMFKASDDAWPLGITFEGGTLSMPTLKVSDSTECLYRNLMAFEQFHYPKEAYICNYIRFIDELINTEDDVDMLIEKGVIVNSLGNNEKVSDLFNDLNNGIVRAQFCYETIFQQLNDHYGNRWYRTVAIMRRVYFSNLWRGSGTVAAFILLILTLIQSIRSFMEIF